MAADRPAPPSLADSVPSGGTAPLSRSDLEEQLAIHKERSQQFQEVVVGICRDLVRESGGHSAALRRALGRIGEFAHVDRCFVYEFSAGLATSSLVHDWVRPGIPSVRNKLQNVSTAPFGPELAKLSAGQILAIQDVEDLPNDRHVVREFYRALGVRSVVNVPIRRGGKLTGMLGLSTLERHPAWSSEELSILQALGDILLGAVERARLHRQLRESEQRFRSVIQDQGDLILRWRPDGRYVFVNQAVCDFLQVCEQQALQRNVYDDVEPEVTTKLRQKVSQLTPESPAAVDQHYVTRHDGRRFWMEWVDRGTFDLAEQLVEIQSVGRDMTEARQMRHELQASELRYKAVLQDQTDVIVRWRPDGLYTLVNPAACEFLQVTEEEALQRNVFDEVDPEYIPMLKEKLAGLTPDHPAKMDEHPKTRGDGRRVWMQWVDRGIFDDQGLLVEIQSVGRDITESRRFQTELQHRADFEQLIVELSNRLINQAANGIDAVIEEALGEVARFISAESCSIYRISAQPDELSQTHEWQAPALNLQRAQYLKFSAATYATSLSRLEAGKAVVTSTFEHSQTEEIGSDERTPLTKIDVPIFLRGKLVAFMSLSSHELTSPWTEQTIALLRLAGELFVAALVRSEAEHQVRLSEERLTRTIEAVGEGVYDWNILTGKVYVSEQWLTMFSFSREQRESLADEWFEAIHPDDSASVGAALHNHFVDENSPYECKYRMRNAQGEYRWVLDRGRVIERTPEGGAARMVGVDRDVTEELEAQRRQHELEAQLAHLSRVSTMGETVAGIAHEVNQPLHAAATFSAAARTALERNQPDSREKALELSQKVSDQIVRAANIIRRLREFTRPRPVETTDLELNNLIRETAQFVLEVSRQFEVRLQLELAPEGLEVRGDQVQVQQVLVNLLQNAIDACSSLSGRDPAIYIRSSAMHQQAVVEVIDNGEGIGPHARIENLFDPFFTTKDSGMGIGLALCRTIMEAHQGTISAERNQHHGMTFRLTFPLAPHFVQ